MSSFPRDSFSEGEFKEFLRLKGKTGLWGLRERNFLWDFFFSFWTFFTARLELALNHTFLLLVDQSAMTFLQFIRSRNCKLIHSTSSLIANLYTTNQLYYPFLNTKFCDNENNLLKVFVRSLVPLSYNVIIIYSR